MLINTEKTIIDEIGLYADPVLASEAYKECLTFGHHCNTTIADHMVHVAFVSLTLCSVLSFVNIDLDRRRMVLISMTHDLAMVHRHEYSHGWCTTAFKHPLESAAIASDILPLSDKAVKAVKRHMWPLCVLPPTCREGWILTLSDKICAFQELFGTQRAWAELVCAG